MGKMQMGGKMNMYWQLAITTVISGIVMYLVMFVMIDNLGSFYNNINMFYMTLMMVAPMTVVMIPGMLSMFPNKKLNYALIAIFGVIFLLSWALIRWQYPIGNTQFLRSMIPHHSGAILMCQEAAITDAEITKLCGEIVESQKREIEQIKVILDRMR